MEPYEYEYVRQWSVDVAALADQLENPKAHLSTSRVTLASRQQVYDANSETNTGTSREIAHLVTIWQLTCRWVSMDDYNITAYGKL